MNKKSWLVYALKILVGAAGYYVWSEGVSAMFNTKN
jgi:hypothetical protein